MKIGILKTDNVRPELANTFGEYPDMFQALLKDVDSALTFSVYDVERGEYPKHLDEAEAYLITGSKASAYEELDWVRKLADFTCELHLQRKKLIGICFGHQVVMQALGGKVEKSTKGWGVGVHAAHFTELPSWHDQGEERFHLLVSHQDQVIQPPPEARIWAGSDFCPNAVCQIGEHILTFQGHPEFIKDYAKSLLHVRRETIGEDKYQKAMASLGVPLDRKRVAGWLVNFLTTH